MRIDQAVFREGRWLPDICGTTPAHLVFAFTSRALLARPDLWTHIRTLHPNARIIGCTTAGEIVGVEVLDDACVCTALTFQKAKVAISTVSRTECIDAAQIGRLLIERLAPEGLKHVIVFTDGLNLNGSLLASSMARALPAGVGLTGGLAGDGHHFKETRVCVDDPSSPSIGVAVGFYGSSIHITSGCGAGWDAFGVERTITRASGNVLQELDGEPALALYKRYLGPHAADLPASALNFPLAIRAPDREEIPRVRSVLGVDEAAQSLTFAGEMPLRYRARLMKANSDRLIEGAHRAAVAARDQMPGAQPQLALMISCVGRKRIMGQRVDEEIEAVRDALGTATVLGGFYSYGELAATSTNGATELHNQTMTVTAIGEQ